MGSASSSPRIVSKLTTCRHSEAHSSDDRPDRGPKPSSPYSASKAAADHLVKSYVRTYKIDAAIRSKQKKNPLFRRALKRLGKAVPALGAVGIVLGAKEALAAGGREARDKFILDSIADASYFTDVKNIVNAIDKEISTLPHASELPPLKSIDVPARGRFATAAERKRAVKRAAAAGRRKGYRSGYKADFDSSAFPMP